MSDDRSEISNDVEAYTGDVSIDTEVSPGIDGGDGSEELSKRKTEFYYELDDSGAANSFTVVQPGQLVYFRSISNNEIKIEFPTGAFVHETTLAVRESPLVLQASGKPEAVRINPDAEDHRIFTLNVIDEVGDHGSPTLIVRKTPIGSS